MMMNKPHMPKSLVGSVETDADVSDAQLIGYNPSAGNPSRAGTININADGSFGGTGALDEKLRVPYDSGKIELYVAADDADPQRVIAESQPSAIYEPTGEGTEMGVTVSVDEVIRSSESANPQSLHELLADGRGDIDLSLLPDVSVDEESDVRVVVSAAEIIIDGSVVTVEE